MHSQNNVKNIFITLTLYNADFKKSSETCPAHLEEL